MSRIQIGQCLKKKKIYAEIRMLILLIRVSKQVTNLKQ